MIQACLIFVWILLSNKISVQIYKYTSESVYVYILISVCIMFYKMRGEENLYSELYIEIFVSFNLQIGAEHIPACPSFVLRLPE